MFLQEISQVIVDILSRYYFEKSVFEKRKEGELTPDEFCTLMTDAQKKHMVIRLMRVHTINTCGQLRVIIISLH